MSSLLAIATKAPIIPTFSARALRDTSADVRDTYAWHASTYVEQPALAELRQSFVEAVTQAKTPKACLIAPFGYGKTASAIGLWNACAQAGLLVVPPISCGSFTELAGAIYGWLTFALPDSAPSLTEAHDKFLVSSAESLARHDERAFGIPFDQAVTAIRDKLERGYLDFDDVSINLLAFLEQATAVVQRAGYSGLVVMIDEFQQLLGNANKGVLLALRQLIWSLRVRKLPFGLVLTMDPDTERTLSDRAGDILHRIKDDGFYLDIRHIYDHAFPARLWQQYTTALDLSLDEQHAIDHPALEALGQLCERDDLSNGPRTVINVLQRAADRWATQGQAIYTPINLVDDLLTGTIRFDGDRGVVPALVAELLNFPYFQRSGERAAALKLIAAFPRGCPEQVAEQYGLGQAWRELNDDLRGEIVTETDEGLALIELQRVGRPANRLNILLRRYWMQITDQQLFAEDAVRVFRDIVLPQLFPSKVHDLNGWSGVAEIELTADNTYAGIIEGTSSTAFPLRRIAISVRNADLSGEPIEPVDDVDLQLVFALDVRPDATSSVMIEADGVRVIATLAVGRVAEQGLYGSIGWIAHYLSPHPISPAVVLSLLRYLRREHLDTLPERDYARIEDTLARLREWLLAELFPSALFASSSITVVSTGAGAIKEFFFQLFTRRWLGYHALVRFPTWAAMLKDYQRALGRVALPAKIGQELVTGSKIQIAELFEQKRHAGFDSYARQYGVLLQLETWQGNDAAIRLLPHPAEIRIAEQVRSQGVCEAKAIYAGLRREGFAAVEAAQIISLATARGLLKHDGAQITVPAAPTALELETRLQALSQRAQTLGSIPEHLSTLLIAFNPAAEHAAAAAWRLEQAERQLSKLEDQAAAAMKAHREGLRRQIMQHLPQLEQELPTPPAGTLIHQLRAVRKELVQKRGKLKDPANTFVANPDPALPLSTIETLASQVETWASQMRHYANWIIFARDLVELQEALGRIESENSGLELLRRQLDQLNRQARSIQAEIGMKGLAEVDRLSATLADLNRQFDNLADERRVAYDRTAARIRDTVASLLDLPISLPIPAYQPAKDAQSYWELQRSIAMTTSRAIALLEVGLVENQKGTSQEKMNLGGLRKRIREVAAASRNPDKLFTEPPLSLRPGLVERIHKLRAQVAAYKQPDTTATKTRSGLVAALSDLPSGPTNISSLLDKMNDAISRDELFKDLLQLHENGLLRLVVDLPEPGDA
jgi:cell division protein FtsB